MSNPYGPKYNPEFVEKLPEWFIDPEYDNGLTITQVCAWHLKVSRETYYQWKKEYPDFCAAANHGEQLAQAKNEVILSKGLNGKITGYNSTAHIFAMKNQHKETYGELGVNVPHPVQKTAEETKKEAELLEQHERDY